MSFYFHSYITDKYAQIKTVIFLEIEKYVVVT